MKKFITLVLLLAVCATGFAGAGTGKGVPKEQLLSLVREYRHKDGVDVVSIGALGTSLARSVAKIAVRIDGDTEAVNALKLANGINRVCVVDYEDCAPEVRDSFKSKLEKALSQSELLMEVKDSEDHVRMFGVVNDDASRIKDFVIFVPNDCALVCLFGSIPMEAVGKIVEDMK